MPDQTRQDATITFTAKTATPRMEARMRKIAFLAVVTAMVAMGASLWVKSTSRAVEMGSGSTITGYELHMKTDTSKLPVQDVRDPI